MNSAPRIKKTAYSFQQLRRIEREKNKRLYQHTN